MSTALDLYLLDKKQLARLRQPEDVEELDDLRAIYGLTNMEIDDVAAQLGCAASADEPLVLDMDEGLVVTRWSPELVRGLAGLAESRLGELAEALEDEDGVFLEGLRKLAELCREAVKRRRTVVQVAAF